MFTKRTDLAIEAHELWQESAGKTTRLAGVKATEKKIQGYPVTQVDILDREGEAALGKPAGSYRTLDLTAFWQRGDGFFDRAVRAVGQQVKELTPDSGPVLVVGLGNRAMTPDAVGPLAADSILITRHLIDAMPQHFSGFRPVAALRPGVLGTTGVESAEAVQGLVDRLHPSAVIAVDALASRRVVGSKEDCKVTCPTVIGKPMFIIIVPSGGFRGLSSITCGATESVCGTGILSCRVSINRILPANMGLR